MGEVAEVLARDGEQLGLAEAAGMEGVDAHHVLEQVTVVVLQVMQQHLAHVALALAMAQQQHRIGTLKGRGNLLEVGGVEGNALTGKVTVVAMGEVLTGGPGAMGTQQGVLGGLALQAKQMGLVMVQHQHQAQGLIAAGGVELGLRMLGCDPHLRQQMA